MALVSKEQPAITSWKERSAAKKHGWGACFSLGRVLASITHLEQSDLDRTLFQAVEQLVHCVQHTSFLSEKVVLAAMGSLRALKPIKLVIVTRKSGLVGEALVYCSLLLFVEGCNPRYREEGNLLLSHLLSCASFSDVAIVLKHPEISRSMLESLYQWMVEQEMEGRTFEIFALGLQRPVLSEYYDVSLEQRFASRALLQYKKEHSIELHSDDDGGDEI